MSRFWQWSLPSVELSLALCLPSAPSPLHFLALYHFFLDLCTGGTLERKKFLWQSLCATCKDLLAKLLHFAYRGWEHGDGDISQICERFTVQVPEFVALFLLFFRCFSTFHIWVKTNPSFQRHRCHRRCKAL